MSQQAQVPTTYGATFTQAGREWRVKSVTSTFIIATATDIEGEPESHHDMIKVSLQ